MSFFARQNHIANFNLIKKNLSDLQTYLLYYIIHIHTPLYQNGIVCFYLDNNHNIIMLTILLFSIYLFLFVLCY